MDPMVYCYHIFVCSKIHLRIGDHQNPSKMSIRSSTSQDSGRSRGFGFVTFTTSAAMDAAVRPCAQKW